MESKLRFSKKETIIKGYGNKKLKIEIEKTTTSGYTFYAIKKNGYPIIKCDEREYFKLKKFFNE